MVDYIQLVPFEASQHKVMFPSSPLALIYCQGHGLEIGASAHNRFNLPDCLNIAVAAFDQFYQDYQVSMSGSYARVDLSADAAAIPLESRSVDYVISSHMIEHHADPLACLLEWSRLIKLKGVIFIIFPKHDALPEDVGRPISTREEIVQAHKLALRTGGQTHVYVYDLQLMLGVVAYFNRYLAKGFTLEVVEALETDDKVGNGHCVILRKASR